MNETFHRRPYYRNLGIICLIFFVGMIVLSVFCVFSERSQDVRIYAVCLFVAFWGFWATVSVWVLLAYWRESLGISDGRVTQNGVIRTRAIAFAELVDVQWRVTPAGGSIVLRSTSAKIKVYLNNFEPEQGQFLINLFHRSVPHSLQRGWRLFCYKVALPQHEHAAERPLGEDEVLITRRRWDWFFLPWLLLAIAVAPVLGWQLHDLRILLFPLAVAGLWLLMRMSTPAKGMRTPRSSSSQHRVACAILGWGASGIGGVFLFNAFQVHLPHPQLLAAMGMVAWFCILLVFVYREDRNKRRDDQAKAELAAEEWERQEAECGEEL